VLVYRAKDVNNYGAMDAVYKRDGLSRKNVDSNSLSYKELCMLYPIKGPTATTTIIYKHRRKKT
jgi:hypothetical protein